MNLLIKAIVIVLGVFIFISVCYGISGFIIMFVWNLLANYFGFKTITFVIGITISLALSIVGGVFKTTVNKK